MSSTVKDLKVTYNPINEKNTFTCGDIVTGQVTLEVVKDCQIDSLSIKFKGKSEVLWTERHGQVTVVYHSKDKYFSLKHYFIHDKNVQEDNQTLINLNGDTYNSVVAPGCHVYPFSFKIPSQDMPSSFNGECGKIVYSLQARLGRSMRIDKKDTTKINFESAVDLSKDPELLKPQHESKDKKMKVFTSGTVAMDVNLEKTGFFQGDAHRQEVVWDSDQNNAKEKKKQEDKEKHGANTPYLTMPKQWPCYFGYAGEGMKVLACIQNNSSREIKPKFCVYRKHSFFARGKRRVHTKDLLKEVGQPIPSSTNQNVTQVISIPHDAEPSILNCSNIKVEHRLRVYLDVKYASDPEIKFPIILLPVPKSAAFAPAAAASDFGLQAFGNINPPTWGIVPPPQQQALPPAAAAAAAAQPFDPPPPYGSYAMYPPLTDFGSTY